MKYLALAKWMPTPVAFAAIPFAIVLGLLFACGRFLFGLGVLRFVTDRIYYYVITPLWEYSIEGDE